MKTVLIIIMLSISITTTAFALDDTTANRIKEAEHYLKTTPPEALMADMAENVAMNLPPEKRAAFKDILTKHLDIAVITQAMKDSMVKHFTADELQALADFYGSKIGKSAMKNFGSYMADVMPTIQAEMLKAQGKAIQAEAEANRLKSEPNSTK